jgi:hypothetical protein
MAYGSVLADTVQGSTASTPPVFKDGNGTQIGTLCRAWVNFNGTGTVAIRASFNVSSITDNGTGDYTVNFTTALPDANYSTSVATNNEVNACSSYLSTQSTTSQRIVYRNTSGVASDVSYVNVSVFR